jgi:hypothetical protein
MDDDFHVRLPALTQLAGSFESRQRALTDLGGPPQHSAGSLVTGDAALDAETRQLFGRIAELTALLGEVFATASVVLAEAAADYKQIDDEAKDGFLLLRKPVSSTPAQS